MSARVRRVDPGEAAVVGDVARRWGYADAFECTPLESRTAEEWARATLEQGPVALRLFIAFGWRNVLRLRLGPKSSAEHVGGWPIARRTPQTVVLEVESGALGHARLTFHADSSVVSASSNVSFERRGARTLWAVAGLLHRQILPYLLAHAAAAAGKVRK